MLKSLKVVIELAEQNVVDDPEMEEERECQEEALRKVKDLYDLLEKLKNEVDKDVKVDPI